MEAYRSQSKTLKLRYLRKSPDRTENFICHILFQSCNEEFYSSSTELFIRLIEDFPHPV